MDRHEATTAFVEAGIGDSDAEALGLAVELLSSVPCRFLVEAGTAAIDNAGPAVMAEPVDPVAEPDLIDVVEDVKKETAPPVGKKKK